MRMRKKTWKLLFFWLFGCVLVTLALIFVNQKKDEIIAPEVERINKEDVLREVGTLMYLPENEDPAIIEVIEPSDLPQKPFFAEAQKGDIVLMYTKEKKVILYRPKEHRIISVAPVSL